jgi:uncharacterized membrane protein
MNPRPLISAGMLLGIGMGGFVDGIVFHQIIQAHNMLSAVLPKTTLVNAEINMFWDGLFHAFTWITTAAGIYLLWKAGANRNVPWSGTALLGAMLLGWGLFNFVEGIIDHYVLGIHHVIERLGLSIWDAVFVVTGPLFGAAGWWFIRQGRETAPRGGHLG